MATEMIMTGKPVTALGPVAVSAGLNGTEYAIAAQKGGTRVTWAIVYGTAPGAVNMLLQGQFDLDNDPVSWYDLDANTNVAGGVRSILTEARRIRIRMESVTGGGTVRGTLATS